VRQIYIGTSGWSYKHWQDTFYNDIPRKDWLAFYARYFPSVEINATFYRLQSTSTFNRWFEQTPAQFRFAIKANRYLTHNRKLQGPEASILTEKSRAMALQEKLAVVLWQLPKSWSKNLPRLQLFARALGCWHEVRHCLEFRQASWFDAETAVCLAEAGIAVCISDAADWPIWEQTTTDLVYLRLHGHRQTYASSYSDQELQRWAEKISRWSDQGRQVYVYFDNDARGAAPENALTLQSLLHISPLEAIR